MLEVFVKIFSSFMLAICGYYFIKKIKNTREKLNKKIIAILVINSLLTYVIRLVGSGFFTAILSFILNVITYKKIFKQSIEETIIETGILTFFIISADMITALSLVTIFHFAEYYKNNFIFMIINIIISIIPVAMINIRIISDKINLFLKAMLKKDLKINGFFIILTMVATSGLGYNIMTNYNLNFQFIVDIVVVESIIMIGIIYMNNKDTYEKLSNEYDVLLQNVQTFEEWIEKEQFTRHEYKNQLAVLYAMSSEKDVKNKIEEIISQNLNIKNEVVNNLRELPKGGLKGLLYYKTIIAEKKKLKVTVDIGIKENGILQKFTKEKINTLAKIIGIYYDNAIDAAKESKKKIILLEIYELKNRINIVISNTYKRSSLIENHNEKGISSKGKGHGNGLYYASKILKENNWIEEKQEIIDNYYIETITIRKNTSKK